MDTPETNESRKIIINCEKLETRVAMLAGGRLEEYQVERVDSDRLPGSVYMGRVSAIQPSLQAVFVDIGMDKNAFLHFEDMQAAVEWRARRASGKADARKSAADPDADGPGRGEDEDGRGHDEDEEGRRRPRRPRLTAEDISQMFPVGSPIAVQVVKGPIGTKGPRVTTDISIPGRYLVFMPFSTHVGVSKKIEDAKERERLRKILSSLELPKGTGCICRTVGEGRKALFFARDLNVLLESWAAVEEAVRTRRPPFVAYQEPSLLERSVRDFLTEDIDEVIIDDPAAHARICEFVERHVGKRAKSHVRLYEKASPIFEYFKVQEQISMLFGRKVPLPGGGYICLDETEALVAVDVNSGSTKGGKDKEETILMTNLEAADEVARQLRLRNVGGLVVIDFIDMESSKHREMVLKRVRKQLKDDRAKTKILPISPLGLMEMTRQREEESLLDRVYDQCPYCKGSGKVKSPVSVSVDIQRNLKELLKRKRSVKDFSVRVVMHPAILARMKNEDAGFLEELESEYGKYLSFRADPNLHVEAFKFVDPETGEEIVRL